MAEATFELGIIGFFKQFADAWTGLYAEVDQILS